MEGLWKSRKSLEPAFLASHLTLRGVKSTSFVICVYIDVDGIRFTIVAIEYSYSATNSEALYSTKEGVTTDQSRAAPS